jgi:hypothetical protein
MIHDENKYIVAEELVEKIVKELKWKKIYFRKYFSLSRTCR